MRPSVPPAPSTAMPASAGSTGWPAPRRPTASTRSRPNCRSSGPSPGFPARHGRSGRGAIVACPMDHVKSLRAIFGFDHFRAGQAEAVAAALADRDALVVMPTGSGKSLCYQLPALMRDDLTLVVSPLVSLMQDQVAALRSVAPGRVELVNAQQGGAANAEALERAAAGEVRLLYVAPERFASPAFASALARARVGLFVVDEAHCISQWGHDFRPDYFFLAEAARRVGARATMGLTATATPAVADDIARRLALPAIVYAGTRRASEEVAGFLRRTLGEEVLAYHAGLDRGVRAATQQRFMSGEARVIVATNAF